MPSAKERRCEPDANDGFSGFNADYPAAHGEDIAVVMLPGKLRTEHVRAERAAYSANLICADGDANTRSADEYSPVISSACYGLSEGKGHIGIIYARGGVTAKIGNVMP